MPRLGISAHSSRISRWACHAASVELKDTDEGWQHAVPNHLLPAQTLSQQLPAQALTLPAWCHRQYTRSTQRGISSEVLGMECPRAGPRDRPPCIAITACYNLGCALCDDILCDVHYVSVTMYEVLYVAARAWQVCVCGSPWR